MTQDESTSEAHLDESTSCMCNLGASLCSGDGIPRSTSLGASWLSRRGHCHDIALAQSHRSHQADRKEADQRGPPSVEEERPRFKPKGGHE